MDTEVISSYCNVCLGERTHKVLHEERNRWDQDLGEGFSIEGCDTYYLCKCCGCGHIHLRNDSWFSEDTDADGRPRIRTAYYPSQTFRREPFWLLTLRQDDPEPLQAVSELLLEIYKALRTDSPRLAAMGIRALTEHVMVDKVGDNGTFKENLQKFLEKGFISSIQKKYLESVIELGHAAMHRSYCPEKEDIVSILDIIESVLETVYVTSNKLLEIENRIPKRNK